MNSQLLINLLQNLYRAAQKKKELIIIKTKDELVELINEYPKERVELGICIVIPFKEYPNEIAKIIHINPYVGFMDYGIFLSKEGAFKCIDQMLKDDCLLPITLLVSGEEVIYNLPTFAVEFITEDKVYVLFKPETEFIKISELSIACAPRGTNGLATKRQVSQYLVDIIKDPIKWHESKTPV